MQADKRITSWTGWLGLMVLDERLKAYRQAQETKGKIQSMILCGAMLLGHVDWQEAAAAIHSAADSVPSSGRVTADLAPQM